MDLNKLYQSNNLRCEIAQITFRNPNNGWTVARVIPEIDKQRQIIAVGTLATAEVGELYEISGKWITHPAFGKQFSFEKSVPILPNDLFSMQKYLSSGLFTGLGEKTAEKIIEHFGNETFNILNNEPHKLHQIQGLGRKKVQKILEGWHEKQSIHAIMLFLTHHQITTNFAQKILRCYGHEAVEILKENPYRLSEDIRGIGFLKADLVAASIGIDPNSIERYKAAILHICKTAESHGHCFVFENQLFIKIKELLKNIVINEATFKEAIKLLSESNKIFIDDRLSENKIYSYNLYIAESYVASKISLLFEKKIHFNTTTFQTWLVNFQEKAQTQFTQTQTDAIIAAASNPVFILTGGPGVGKTTTTHAILNYFKEQSKSVAIAAPTGRAAQRMNELTQTEQAKTIHRLLEWLPDEGRFKKDQDNPIIADVFLIDEVSMLDIQLASSLLAAIPPTAQLILVGDADQLPSVGPGSLLRDLIESRRIPTIFLKEVFRQAAHSNIIRAAHSINRGEFPDFFQHQDKSLVLNCDLEFIESTSPNDFLIKIQETLSKRITRDLGFNPIQDCQIMSPMNRGPVGTIALNQNLQTYLNPKSKDKDEIKIGDIIFRKGDKVIQTQNNYDLGVFNGDIGFISQCNIEGGKSIVNFGNKQVTLTHENLFDLLPAYVITIHKSQGSEFPVVIIPVTMHHFVMLQRNLVYTALTRAKKHAIFIGTKKALLTAIKTIDCKQRQTNLAEKISLVI